MRIEDNLNKLERTVDKLQVETINTKHNCGCGGKSWEIGSVKYLQEDVEDFGKEYDELERTVESLDNSLRKNNLKIWGLK